MTVAFIGGGFAGLVTGARLKQAGIDDVRIIDKGGDVGGTWYWNRYPGAQCDTAAFIYLPLLEETGHMPTEKYTHAPEILEHCQRIAKHFDLYDNACLSTEVTARRVGRADRTAGSSAPTAATRCGPSTSRMGTGPLHRPKLPGIPGIETFAGHSFHTSRWDYDYTGGDPTGAPMIGLADKRVGIIGTGATSVQCIPHLARAAGELFVFQRTPSSIDIRNNHPIDPDWFATLEPGWQDEWLMNFTTLQTGGFADEDLVKDGWTDISQRIRDRADRQRRLQPRRACCGPTTTATTRRWRRSAPASTRSSPTRTPPRRSSPGTASCASGRASTTSTCSRYNNPNVHLVDTDGKGVERIDETGVWVGGEHYELDCLIYASGFEVGTPLERRTGFDPVGRDGITLSEHWADGMRSLHGIHVHGFPNLFIVSPAQGANLISNVPHNLTEAGSTIAAIVAHAEAIGAEEVEVTAEAEDDWVEMLRAGGRTFGADPTCTPGYYNNEGGEISQAALGLGYPDGPVAYFQYIKAWRESGDFEGLEFR